MKSDSRRDNERSMVVGREGLSANVAHVLLNCSLSRTRLVEGILGGSEARKWASLETENDSTLDCDETVRRAGE